MSTRPFTGVMQEAMEKHNFEDGTRISRLAVDFTVGPMRHTERSLDFAIEGDAFFVVEKDDQRFYTRDGSFGVDQEGNLVNASGFRVAGNVAIPPDAVIENLTVGSDGTVFNGIQALGRIDTASFADPHQLVRAGPSLFLAPPQLVEEQPPDNVKIHNRTLESSNTTIFTEMAEMIACMRNFEACQKMINMQDASEGAMLNKINMP